jgi:hypothetical protein
MARLLIQPLDLSQFTPDEQTRNPGFGDLVNSELAGIADDTDGVDQEITAVLGLVDLLDAAGAAQDADLDAILALLDLAQPGHVDQAFNDFAGAQPGAEGFVAGVTSIAVPTIERVPMVAPNGQSVITIGAPPEQGGTAKAGAPQYTLLLPLPLFVPAVHAITPLNLGGPNPPFVGIESIELLPDASGQRKYTIRVLINPARAGSFNAVVYYSVNIDIPGFGGAATIQRTLPFTVLVEA